MTTEEAIKQLKEYILGMNYMDDEAVWVAIKALEQQPCEDCVSRQAVHEMLENIPINESDKWFNWLQKACLRLAELPSVQSTRPTGKWIKMPLIEAGQTYSHECSLCGRRILITDVGLSEFPYCHCGARMAESEDKE